MARYSLRAQEILERLEHRSIEAIDARDNFGMLADGIHACALALLALDERLAEMSVIIRRGQ